MLKDIPRMYRDCKATEDKDMTAFDFITDHLLNIDGLFDKHDRGDEQLPHHPIQNHHYAQSIFSFTTYFAFSVLPVHPDEIKMIIPADNSLLSEYFTTIFRPPITA